MKIFDRDGKLNFVDENNVFVGFDYIQDCCETFGWGLSYEYPTEDIVNEDREDDGIDTEGYVFDPDFCEYLDCRYDEMDVVVFKLRKGFSELYLHLYNSHNGYYSHGFTMHDSEGVVLHDGCL